MADPREETDPANALGDVVQEEECQEQHVSDLDEAAKRFLTTFSTIRSKIDDLARAESDIKRFELAIEQDRKRLAKTLEAAKAALRNARVQMAVELSKLDGAGFSKIADQVKNMEAPLA